MSSGIYITGIGAISAIGTNVQENWNSIITKKSGIGSLDVLNTRYKNILPFAEVKLSNYELINQLNVHFEQFSRTSLLSLLAAKEAAEMANWYTNNQKTAVVSATSVGGMDQGELFYTMYKDISTQEDYERLRTHDCGAHVEQLAQLLHINEYLSTSSTACSSALNAIIHGIRLIKYSGFDKVMVGGADALSKFTINGFNSLMILSDKHTCPYDQNRNGLNLGEGAGYLVLESEKSLRTTQNKPLAQISGYANACDAYHQTASSPDGEGAFKAMYEALENSKLKPEHIDYINTHGTGTINNDLSESIALKNLFKDCKPRFSSTKAYTGHTLAASGGIESVFCVMSILNDLIPPNLNFYTPMTEVDIKPTTDLVSDQKVNHVLKNSFGFGGNNSSIVFSKC